MTEPRTRPRDTRRTGDLVVGLVVAVVAWSAGFWALAVLTEVSPLRYAVVLSAVVMVVGAALAVRCHVTAGSGVVLAALAAPWVNLMVLVVLVGD